jgi:hypothetical protein
LPQPSGVRASIAPCGIAPDPPAFGVQWNRPRAFYSACNDPFWGFCIAGARDVPPFRVLAPQRGVVEGSFGGLPCFRDPRCNRYSFREVTWVHPGGGIVPRLRFARRLHGACPPPSCQLRPPCLMRAKAAVVNDPEQSAIAEVGYSLEECCYLLSSQVLGSPGCSLPLFKGPNRMAILFGNSRFCAVFANVFVVGHVGNCAVVCVWQP